jgi:hypothetical protein
LCRLFFIFVKLAYTLHKLYKFINPAAPVLLSMGFLKILKPTSNSSRIVAMVFKHVKALEREALLHSSSHTRLHLPQALIPVKPLP